MRYVPRLLNEHENTLLPKELFSDLQLDKILSDRSVSILQKPCKASEIRHRNEIFRLLEEKGNLERMEALLAVLSDTERSLRLLRDTKIPLDRYYRYAKAFDSYINCHERLSSMADFGSLFSDIAEYSSSEAKQQLLASMRYSTQTINALLGQLHTGLLSFSDKNWLTPDYEAESEFDRIAECAGSLGFSVPEKKKKSTRVNLSLSDAICRLYEKEIAEVEAEISKFADVDLYEPLVYISEIQFFLEIHALIQRANSMGVPHCTPKVAKEVRYTAKELYDISLLAKQCNHIVPNDADFTEDEPFCFLLGANGGGKTTYLRAVGINLLLFLAGCPVFAREAEIYPYDVVLSHFPKDERFDHTGRLDEERERTENMLGTAHQKSAFLLFNETFSGSDDQYGFELLKVTAEQIRRASHSGLYVTHFHEVMSLDYPVLSAEVDPADKNKRTFRIVRSKGSASSYAIDILKKYRIDKDSLAKRRDGYGN